MKKTIKSGEPWVWLTGAALGFALIMVIGLIGLILVNGLGFFWPSALHEFRLQDGTTTLGHITAREIIPQPDAPPGRPNASACRSSAATATCTERTSSGSTKIRSSRAANRAAP